MLYRLILTVAASVGFACPAFAAVVTANVPCGPGVDDNLTLWIEASSGTCNQTMPGVFECWEAGGDYVKADCLDGCVETHINTAQYSVAGCWRGANPPGFVDPNHTVACSDNGPKFDLKGVPGDECKTTIDGTSGKVVGGECAQYDQNGNKIVSSSANCTTGCQTSRPPGDCNQR